MPITIEERLPLSQDVFHIMLALADGRRHGYAIMREVKANSQDQIGLQASTLYDTIKPMINDGFIEETEGPDPADAGSSRRHYQLTELGLALVAAEAKRLAHLVSVARDKKLMAAEE